MQSNSGWVEPSYSNKTLKQTSSVKYDIISIEKKP